MAAEEIDRHLFNGSWYLTSHENLEKILYAIGKSIFLKASRVYKKLD